MAKRYVLCTMFGTGTLDDPKRPVIADMDIGGYAITIAPVNQRTTKPWVLCVVAGTASQLQAVETAPNADVLPVGPSQLDTQWLSIGNNSVRNQFANAIRNRTGVQVTRDDPRTLREIITAIGQVLDPTFNPNNLDINDDTTALRAR